MTDPKDKIAQQRYQRALEFADCAYSEIPAETVLTSTERGGLKVHPALTLWLLFERAAADFGERLGVEVDSPKRPAGRPKGAASAPDRTAEPPILTRIK